MGGACRAVWALGLCIGAALASDPAAHPHAHALTRRANPAGPGAAAVPRACSLGRFVIHDATVVLDAVHQRDMACSWVKELAVPPPRHAVDGRDMIFVYHGNELLDVTADPRWVDCAPPLNPEDAGVDGGAALVNHGVFEALIPTALFDTAADITFSVPPSPFANITATLHTETTSRRRAQKLDASIEHFTLQRAGPVDRQNNVIILSGGYTAAEKDRFFGDADQLVRLMQLPGDFAATVPFARYTSMLNIFRVWQPSAQSGASKPARRLDVDNNLGCTYGTGASGNPERMLRCESELVQALANTAPCGADGKQNVVVVTIVNDGDYGGAASHHERGDAQNTIYRHAWFFNGYLENRQDASAPKPSKTNQNKYASLYFHEVGHAYSNLNDEYSIGASLPANSNLKPQKNCENDAGFSNPKWQAWINEASADQYRSVAARPVQVCGYSNWYKPSEECLMEALGASRLCPVCREASTISFYETSQDITNPRCPQEGEILLLEPGELAHLYVNKRLQDLGSFSITWMFEGAVVQPDHHPTAMKIVACAGATGCGGVKALPIGTHKIKLSVTDNTDFVKAKLPEMSVTTEYTVQVVAAGTKAGLATQEKNCHEGEERKLFAMPLLSEQIPHASRCDPDTSKTCSIEYTSSVYQQAADLNELSDALEGHIFGIVGGCVGGLLLLFILVWCVIQRDNAKRAKCIFKEERPRYLETIRWIMIGSAVVFMIGALVVIGLSLGYYSSLGAVGKILVFAGLVVAIILFIMAFVGFTGAWYRSKCALGVNGAILLLCVLVSLAWTVFAIIFHENVEPRDNTGTGDQGPEGEGGVSNDIGEGNAVWSHSWLRDLWVWMAEDHDDMLCSLQQVLECSGWYRSCVQAVDNRYCPENCEATHSRAYAFTPCETQVIDSFEDNFTIIIVISVIVTLAMITGLVFNFILRNSIGKFRQRAGDHLENRRAKGGTDGRASMKARHYSMRKMSTKPQASPLLAGGAGGNQGVTEEANDLLELLFALSPKEKEQLRQEFRRVDQRGNKNGKLDEREFRVFIKSALLVKVSPEGTKSLFNLFDKDSNGEITMAEFDDILLSGENGGTDSREATFGLGATMPSTDWKEAKDEKGRAYYWNTKTKETSRELHEKTLHPDWREAKDAQGRAYYWHKGTKETTRNLGPEHYVMKNRLTGEVGEPGGKSPALMPGGDAEYWAGGARPSFCTPIGGPAAAPAGKSPAAAPASEWREATDPKGRAYYWNKQTKETTRELWRAEPGGQGFRNLLTNEVLPYNPTQQNGGGAGAGGVSPAVQPQRGPPVGYPQGAPHASPQKPLLHNAYI